MRKVLFLFLAVLLTGCATTVPLLPVDYESEATIQTDKTATVKLQTGAIEGSGSTNMIMVGSGVFVPMTTGPLPHLQFNEEDQAVFIDLLESELTRLGILKTIVPETNEQSDIEILILFAQTYHNPNMQQYTLNVAMQITGEGEKYGNKYNVLSSEGDSWWAKMNTNASQGKQKAAKNLLSKLIPDIENWLKNNE